MSTRINQQDGRFTFRGVSPGRYTILAQTVAQPMQVQFGPGTPPPPPPTPQVLADNQRLWGKTEISVDGPAPMSVSVSLQPGKSISGTGSIRNGAPPDLTRARTTVTLAFAPAPQTVSAGPAPQAQIGPDGKFTLSGVIPGRYILRAGGGMMKSSIVNGQDTLDFPLEFTGERDIAGAVLTVTDKSSELTGLLTDGAGKPAVDFTIVVAPSDPRFWVPGGRRIMITRPDTAGRYTFRSLPPGDYMVAAVTDMEQGGQYDPEFLKAIASASVRVMVQEAARVSQDLRVGPPPPDKTRDRRRRGKTIQGRFRRAGATRNSDCRKRRCDSAAPWARTQALAGGMAAPSGTLSPGQPRNASRI